MRPFYSICFYSGQILFRLFFHISVKGRENVPKRGAFIAASNHIAYFDPVFIGSSIKREINYLARAELFDQFLIKGLIKKLNAFPVRRGEADFRSVRACISLLVRKGMPLLMFPEGTRIRIGRLGIPHKGIAVIAARTRVPILPVYIENSNKLGECALFKKRLTIRIGKIIPFHEYEDMALDKNQFDALAKLIMARIQELKDQVSFEGLSRKQRRERLSPGTGC